LLCIHKEKRLKKTVEYLLLALIAYLSMPVVMNLLSPRQAMNTSFEPFRIVNTYGAFGRLRLNILVIYNFSLFHFLILICI
jgi:hypothetical protein